MCGSNQNEVFHIRKRLVCHADWYLLLIKGYLLSGDVVDTTVPITVESVLVYLYCITLIVLLWG